MKIDMIYSNYNEDTGVSTVTINTDYGQFTATSKLHIEDKEIASNFAGCHYAEMKAIMMYFKKRIEIIKVKIVALQNLQKTLMNKKDYDHNSMENRTIRKEIYLLQKQRADWEKRIYSLREKMITQMEQREKVIRHIVAQNQKGDK